MVNGKKGRVDKRLPLVDWDILVLALLEKSAYGDGFWVGS